VLFVGLGAAATYYGFSKMAGKGRKTTGDIVLGSVVMPLGATFGLLYAFNIGHAHKDHKPDLDRNMKMIHQYTNNPINH
jgi:hypothetical protein